MGENFLRNLIAVEIELGFLYIPKKYREFFPKKKAKIKVYLGESKKSSKLLYNPEYNRVYGMVRFYRKHEAKPRDGVLVELIGEGKFKFIIKRKTMEVELTPEEAELTVDLSGLDTKVKGKIVEDRIKDLILLYGQGLLNVYHPSSDIEGVDLVVKKKGIFQPLFIQVKSRWKLLRDRGLLFQVAEKNLRSHHTYYLIGAYFDPKQLALYDLLVFIPTKKIKKEATVIKTRDRGVSYRFTVPLDLDSTSRFTKYLIRKTDLVNKLLEKFNHLEEVLK